MLQEKWGSLQNLKIMQVTRKMGISTKFQDNASTKKNGDLYKI